MFGIKYLYLDFFSFYSIFFDLFLQISLCLIKFVAQQAQIINKGEVN